MSGIPRPRRAPYLIRPLALVICLTLILLSALACGSKAEPPAENQTVVEQPPALAVLNSWSMDNKTHLEPMVVPGVTTASDNTLFVALIASDSGQGPQRGGPPLDCKIQSVDGGGLVWTRRAEAHLSITGEPSVAEIWTAFSPDPVEPFAVTVTRNNDNGGLTYCDNWSGGTGPDIANGMVFVQAIIGADPENPVGATAIAGVGPKSGQVGPAYVTLTTTQANSLVEAVGADWSEPRIRTLPPGQVLLHMDVSTPNGDSYWAQGFDTIVPTVGTVTLSVLDPSEDDCNMAAIEILQAL